MKVFFDTEFTGLRPDTDLISIGAVTEDGIEFYAEATDYSRRKVNRWVQDHVISGLHLQDTGSRDRYSDMFLGTRIVKGPASFILDEFDAWLQDFNKKIVLWADVPVYDWWLVMSVLHLNVDYAVLDLATAFAMKGLNHDINREKFAGISTTGDKHNALVDAKVARACFEKLTA